MDASRGSGGKRIDLRQGARLADRYEVLRRVGAGGMGTVYEVRDEHLDERAALKLLHADLGGDNEHRDRLREEVKLARRVTHPNVCRVHDLGQHDGQLFVTMELVAGASLRARVVSAQRGRAAPMPLARKVDLIAQLCAGLAAAHHSGVLHRDVKPDNVLLGDDRVALTDFGVASLVELGAQRGTVAGTAGYMAPETLRGEVCDHRADIYSAGVVAYELLADRRPFSGSSVQAALDRAHGSAELLPLPSDCAPARARELLYAVLARALDPDPGRRFASALELAEGLAHAVRGELGEAPAPGRRFPRASTGGDVDVSGMDSQPASTPSSTPSGRSLRSEVRVVTALCVVWPHAMEEAAAATAEAPITDIETHPAHAEALSPEQEAMRLGGRVVDASSRSLVALFGAPLSLGDDPARAAAAARLLVERVPGARSAVHTARVLYRAGASEPQAFAEAIDRARALASRAGAGELRASREAARHLAGRYRVREAPDGAVVIEGDGEKAAAPAPGAALSGRGAELEAFESLIKRAFEQRQPAFAAVVGVAGAGKTRVRNEVMRRIAQIREVEWLVGAAAPLGEAAPLSLLRSASSDWFRAAARAGVRDRRAALASAQRWLELRAARRPVVAFFEDVQWADEASLELLSELESTLADVPVAMIRLGRPDDEGGQRASLVGGARSIIELAPLPEDACVAIARQLAPAAQPAELREVARLGGGNPLFVTELARDLRERGGRPGPVAALPATVEAVIQARLDRLPREAKELACAAAVVGREFWREAAACALEVLEGESPQLDELFFELERRGIAVPVAPALIDDDRYAFAGALLRDVAYQQLAPRDRRRAHAAVARWLERASRGSRSLDPSIAFALATHRERGGDPSGASAAYREAGKLSLRLFAYHEAMAALQKASELASEPDAELFELLGDALVHAQGNDTGRAAYRDALERAKAPLERARICAKLGYAASRLADNDDAVRWYERGLDIVAPGGELSAEARAEATVAATLFAGLGSLLGYTMGENERGLRLGERAVALLEGTAHRWELAHALSRLGGNYMRAGRFRDQLRCNQRNLEIGEEKGDLMHQAVAHINLGETYKSLGDIDRALEHTRRAVDLCTRTGAASVGALARSNVGGLLLERGELEEARIEIDEAIRLGERAANRTFLPEAYGFSARLRVDAGDLEGADRDARRALALAESSGSLIDAGVAARILSLVRLRCGDVDEAIQLAARSRACLEGADDCEAARTCVAEARILAARGGPGDAEYADELLRAAEETFERLGAARDLDRLKGPTSIR